MSVRDNEQRFIIDFIENDGSKRVLWVHGMPGVGKTYVMDCVAKKLSLRNDILFMNAMQEDPDKLLNENPTIKFMVIDEIDTLTPQKLAKVLQSGKRIIAIANTLPNSKFLNDSVMDILTFRPYDKTQIECVIRQEYSQLNCEKKALVFLCLKILNFKSDVRNLFSILDLLVEQSTKSSLITFQDMSCVVDKHFKTKAKVLTIAEFPIFQQAALCVAFFTMQNIHCNVNKDQFMMDFKKHWYRLTQIDLGYDLLNCLDALFSYGYLFVDPKKKHCQLKNFALEDMMELKHVHNDKKALFYEALLTDENAENPCSGLIISLICNIASELKQQKINVLTSKKRKCVFK